VCRVVVVGGGGVGLFLAFIWVLAKAGIR